jgi:hypothetical protein
VFTIDRIECSGSTGLDVHDQTESVFTIHRNAQSGIKREVAGLTAQERDLTETGAECIFGEQVSSVAKR